MLALSRFVENSATLHGGLHIKDSSACSLGFRARHLNHRLKTSCYAVYLLNLRPAAGVIQGYFADARCD